MEIKIEKLRQEIGRLGITLKEFAYQCGVSRQTFYNMWEHPDKFNPATVEKIAKSLDMDAKDLIT